MTITLNLNSWDGFLEASKQKTILKDIEIGKLILLPKLKFNLLDIEKKFLTADCADPQSKNISFNHNTSSLKGSSCIGNDLIQLKNMLVRFSLQARQVIDAILPYYQKSLQWGRTSFRPVNTADRKVASYRKDDSRLHVDAFASQPVHGLRLLRVFSNIHPYLPRIWKLGEPFEDVVTKFLPKLRHKPWINPHILQKLGVTKELRSPYDHLMLQIHNIMKSDLNYQNTVPQQDLVLPSNSTWIVMTDKVSHAALSGQFLLEQTFYLPVESMQSPEQSPLRILEHMLGKQLLK
jgi:hypothetical protein